MPLRKDEQYRGPNAIHVRGHRKVLKHRTVITEAVLLVNWLLEKPEVRMIAFGKMSTNAARLGSRCTCIVSGKHIRVLLIGHHAIQMMRVTTTTLEIAQNLAPEIQSHWETLMAEKPVGE